MPTSWRVREGGGALALIPWCYAARHRVARLASRLRVGMRTRSQFFLLSARRTHHIRNFIPPHPPFSHFQAAAPTLFLFSGFDVMLICIS